MAMGTTMEKTLVARHSGIGKFIICFVMLIVSPLTIGQAYEPFSVLGTSQALCRPGIESAQELQAYFTNNRETVEQVLQHANWQGNSQDLFDAIAQGEFTEGSYPKGTKFEWTSLKKEGKGQSKPRKIWAGEQPFDGFEVNFTSQCQVHRMVIPNACCNLSLVGSSEVATLKPQIRIEANNEEVTICSDYGSEVELTKADGTTDILSLDDNGCWDGLLEEGSITASVTNADECGSASSSASYIVTRTPLAAAIQAAVATPPAAAKHEAGFIPYVSLFAGSETRLRFEPMWQTQNEDDASVFGVNAGFLKPLSGSLSLFTHIGYLDRDGVNTRYVYPNDTIFWDIGIDHKIGKTGFIGAGIGYWNIGDSEYDETSFLVHGGSSIGGSNAQWFVEGRIFEDNVSSDNMTSAGIRYLFK